MIHSRAGGVLADFENILFAKVETSEGPRWYIAPFSVAEGENVLAPVGSAGRLEPCRVLRTELCTRQTAPVPVNRARTLEKKLEND